MSSPARQAPSDPALLAQLLRSGQVRKASLGASARAAALEPLSTGVGALDAALGGGLLRGHLTEVIAAPSAGGTALLRAALGAATRRGQLCALVDPDDAFDPGGALDTGQPDPAGIDLRRLLWIRPATVALALRAAEVAIEARFALVVLDLLGVAADRPRDRASLRSFDPAARAQQVHRAQVERLAREVLALPMADTDRRERVVRTDRDEQRAPPDRAGRGPLHAGPPWARLARRAEQHRSALLVVSRAAQVGAFAAAAIELQRVRARWTGLPCSPGRLLLGAEAAGTVVRLKGGMPSPPTPLLLRWGAAGDAAALPGAPRAGPALSDAGLSDAGLSDSARAGSARPDARSGSA